MCRTRAVEEHGARSGDQRAAEIVAAWCENDAGEAITALAQGEHLTIACEIRFHADLEDPVFAVALRNDAPATIFATRTNAAHGPTGVHRAGETHVVRVRLEGHMASSLYPDSIDLREALAYVRVHATLASGGVYEAHHRFTIRRIDA